MPPQLNVCNLFTFVSNVHSYSTIDHQPPKTNTHNFHELTNKKFFVPIRVGVHLWNKIPEDFRKTSKKKFKEKLRSLLFNNLEILGYNAKISKLNFS